MGSSPGSDGSRSGLLFRRALTLRHLHEQHAQVEEHVLEEPRFLGGQVPARLLLQHGEQVDALLRHRELGLVTFLPRRRVGRLAQVHDGARAERKHERGEVESRSLLLVGGRHRSPQAESSATVNPVRDSKTPWARSAVSGVAEIRASISFFPRTTPSRTRVPKGTSRSRNRSSSASRTGEPSTRTIASPRRSPAAEAGELSSTEVTSAPVFAPSAAAASLSRDSASNPHHASASAPLFCSSLATRSARSMGIAKPIPCPVARTAEQTPITLPSAFSSGPPELPGLIDASVWMKS